MENAERQTREAHNKPGTDPPMWSILVPSICTRDRKVFDKLCRLAEPFSDTVEVLALADNRRRSIGLKRQALLDAARGFYVSFVDDDDDVSDEYIRSVCRAIFAYEKQAGSLPSVVCFASEAWLDGLGPYRVRFTPRATGNPEVRLGETVERPPWHVCVWMTDIARTARFPDSNYGEDWAWASQLRVRVPSAVEMEEVLHYYTHSRSASEASS